jgi:hexosaminidase
MVRKIISIVYVLLFISCNNKLEFRDNVASFLVPKPIKITQQKGYFLIDKNTLIVTPEIFLNEAKYLQQLIEESSNFNLSIVLEANSSQIENAIVLTNNSQLVEELNSEESYKLIGTKSKIEIEGSFAKGIMHGIQTLRQLFVNDFHKNIKKDEWLIPLVSIQDKPKFKHRGMLFDSGRHFFEVDVVKKYIDLLALYKMNVFHWHLTEDQGWRIAIDKYPKLTEIGAYRIQEDGAVYGGFYTKEQVKEIVAYATERHITVIPEIELPGHSQAALDAYPELSCTGNAIEVANKWGVFKDIYCAGNEQTFIFLENVLTEVMELFPSEYIHIGGDEAPKLRWESCNKCQKRIKDEKLADEHELQSYFIQRIERFLHKNNRKLIGWDEILEGGVSPTATVQKGGYLLMK